MIYRVESVNVDIQAIKGDTFAYGIEAIDDAGTKLNLQGDCYLKVSKNMNSAAILEASTQGLNPYITLVNGNFLISIPPDVTNLISDGIYLYSIRNEYTVDGERIINTLAYGNFKVTQVNNNLN